MDQATESNFVIENPITVHGSSSERVIEVMDSNENAVNVVASLQPKYMKNDTGNANLKTQNDGTSEMENASAFENPETVHVSGAERVIELMDSNENVVNVATDMQSKYVKNDIGKSKLIIQNDKTNEMTIVFTLENPEIVHGSGDIEVMDSNENVGNTVANIQSQCIKTGNAKSKTKNVITKKILVPAVSERKSLKRKATHPPTSEMVMDSIKTLKKRNGVSFEDMKRYMEEKYEVNMKLLKHHVNKFLQKGVGNGVVEKVDIGGVEGRFKIKKSENIKKDSKSLPRKEEKMKPKNKMAATKKQVKNVKTKKMIVPAVSERKSLKRKATHPPTSEMVMDSIKTLKKRNGVSFEDIKTYMEENYEVNMKLLKHHVDKFLQKGVGNGVIEKVDKGDVEGRYKIKKSENIKKDSKSLPRKEEKMKPKNKMAATKKQVKK